MEKTKELRAEYEVNADQAPWMLLMSATGADGVVVQGWGLKERSCSVVCARRWLGRRACRRS